MIKTIIFNLWNKLKQKVVKLIDKFTDRTNKPTIIKEKIKFNETMLNIIYMKTLDDNIIQDQNVEWDVETFPAFMQIIVKIKKLNKHEIYENLKENTKGQWCDNDDAINLYITKEIASVKEQYNDDLNFLDLTFKLCYYPKKKRKNNYDN